MMKVIKKEGKRVEAYELGKDVLPNEVLKKVKLRENEYEIFSKESSDHGEIAHRGDFIKIDGDGDPYPNTRKFFLANHKKVGDGEYEQTPKAILAWDMSCPKNDIVKFLETKKGLKITPSSFSAPLWGTVLTASNNAVIIFYSIEYDNNNIKDVDFNFVERGEFERTYNVV